MLMCALIVLPKTLHYAWIMLALANNLWPRGRMDGMDLIVDDLDSDCMIETQATILDRLKAPTKSDLCRKIRPKTQLKPHPHATSLGVWLVRLTVIMLVVRLCQHMLLC